MNIFKKDKNGNQTQAQSTRQCEANIPEPSSTLACPTQPPNPASCPGQCLWSPSPFPPQQDSVPRVKVMHRGWGSFPSLHRQAVFLWLARQESQPLGLYPAGSTANAPSTHTDCSSLGGQSEKLRVSQRMGIRAVCFLLRGDCSTPEGRTGQWGPGNQLPTIWGLILLTSPTAMAVSMCYGQGVHRGRLSQGTCEQLPHL